MWQNKYTLKFDISFLPSSGSACELPGECLAHAGDHWALLSLSERNHFLLKLFGFYGPLCTRVFE